MARKRHVKSPPPVGQWLGHSRIAERRSSEKQIHLGAARRAAGAATEPGRMRRYSSTRKSDPLPSPYMVELKVLRLAGVATPVPKVVLPSKPLHGRINRLQTEMSPGSPRLRGPQRVP